MPKILLSGLRGGASKETLRSKHRAYRKMRGQSARPAPRAEIWTIVEAMDRAESAGFSGEKLIKVAASLCKMDMQRFVEAAKKDGLL